VLSVNAGTCHTSLNGLVRCISEAFFRPARPSNEHQFSYKCRGLLLVFYRWKQSVVNAQLSLCENVHTFKGLFSRTTWVSRHQKGKPLRIFFLQQQDEMTKNERTHSVSNKCRREKSDKHGRTGVDWAKSGVMWYCGKTADDRRLWCE